MIPVLVGLVIGIAILVVINWLLVWRKHDDITAPQSKTWEGWDQEDGGGEFPF